MVVFPTGSHRYLEGDLKNTLTVVITPILTANTASSFLFGVRQENRLFMKIPAVMLSVITLLGPSFGYSETSFSLSMPNKHQSLPLLR